MLVLCWFYVVLDWFLEGCDVKFLVVSLIGKLLLWVGMFWGFGGWIGGGFGGF